MRQSKSTLTEETELQSRLKENLALPLVDQPPLGPDTEPHPAPPQAVNHAEAAPSNTVTPALALV